MKTYGELFDELKAKIKCTYDCNGFPDAFYASNEEDYKLILAYNNAGHMSCLDHSEHYKYDYKGPDWYFFYYKSYSIEMGAYDTSYWQETLSIKKKNYETWLNKFKLGDKGDQNANTEDKLDII